MSLNTIYQSRYYDSEGVMTLVVVEQEDFPGSATWKDLAAVPLKIALQATGNDKLQPIRGSVATESIESESNYELTSLFTPDARKYRMSIYKTTSEILYWRGFVTPEEYQEPYASPGYDVDLMAADQLGALKSYTFVDSSGDKYTSKMTLMQGIVACLNKTGLSLDIYEGINVYETSMDGDPDDSMLTQAYFDPALFLDDDGEPWTCYEVLSALIKSFFSFIFQRNGAWYILRVSELGGDFYLRKFNSSGTYQSYALTNLLKIANDPDVIKSDRVIMPVGGNLMMRGGWKKAIITHHYYPNTFFPEGHPDKWVVGSANILGSAVPQVEGWTDLNSSWMTHRYLHESIELVNLQVMNSSPEVVYGIKVEIDIDMNTSSGEILQLYVNYVAGTAVESGFSTPLQKAFIGMEWDESGTTYYLTSSGGKTTSITYITFTDPGDNNRVQLPITTNDNKKATITIYGFASQQAQLGTGQPCSVWFKEIQVALKTEYGNDVEVENVLERIINENNNNIQDMDIHLADFPDTENSGIYFLGGLYLDTSGTKTSNWQERDNPLQDSLINLFSDWIAEEYTFPTQILDGLMNGKDLSMGDVIVDRSNFSRRFMMNRMELNDRDAEWKGGMMELTKNMQMQWLIKQMYYSGSFNNDLYSYKAEDGEKPIAIIRSIDLALAIINALQEKKLTVADNLMTGLLDLQHTNGSINTIDDTTHVNRTWNDAVCAWAMCYFLDIHTDSTQTSTVETAVKDILDYLDSLRTGSGYLQGLITGGSSITASYVTDNILAFYAFGYYSYLQSDELYGVISLEIQEALLDNMWDSTNKVFYKGASNSTTLITDADLDTYILGYLFTLSAESLSSDRDNLLTEAVSGFGLSEDPRQHEDYNITAGLSPALIRNEEGNNLVSSSTTTLIEITAKSGNTLTLNVLPRDLICSLDIDWFVQSLDSSDYNVPSDPNYSGDYLVQDKITNFDFRRKRITVVDATDLDVGEKIAIYSPWANYEFEPGQESEGIIKSDSGVSWRSVYVSPGAIWYDKSNSRYILIVNGYNGSRQSVGWAYSSDLESWSWGNSGNAFLDASGSSYWSNECFVTGDAIELDNGNIGILVTGTNASGTTMIIVECERDMSSWSIISSSVLPIGTKATGSIKYYNGKWHLVCQDYGYTVAERRAEHYTADAVDGPYTLKSYIDNNTYAGNDSHFLEGHSDGHCLFVENGKLYNIIAGTQRYTISGIKGNRIFGVVVYDEDNNSWAALNDFAPEILFPMYFYNIPSEDYDWAGGHSGNSPCIVKLNGKCYFFCSMNYTTSTYQVAALELLNHVHTPVRPNIEGFGFDDNSRIWFTGTILAALAYYKGGYYKRYIDILRGIGWYMELDGSFRHSLEDDDRDDTYEFSLRKASEPTAVFSAALRFADNMFNLYRYLDALINVTAVTPQYYAYDPSDPISCDATVYNRGTSGSETVEWQLVDTSENIEDSGTEGTGTVTYKQSVDVALTGITAPASSGTYKIKARIQGSGDDWTYSGDITVI